MLQIMKIENNCTKWSFDQWQKWDKMKTDSWLGFELKNPEQEYLDK